MRGAEVDPVAGAEQVTPLDQLGPHEPGQQGVLEVGRVVDAGGEDDDDRILGAFRGGGAQRGEQPGRVFVHRGHPLLGEQAGERARHGQPVLDHVADPGRDPDVVLQDPQLPVLVADQVDARDLHPDAVRRDQAGHLAVEAGGGQQHPPRDHAVGEDLPAGVDVGQERLQRAHPLPDAAHDQVPFHRVDHAGHQVQRERAFLTAQVEGDPPVGEHPGQLVGAEAQLGRIHRLQRADQPVVRRARLPGSREHLVPGLRGLIPVEDVRHVPQRTQRMFRIDYGG